MYLKRVKIMLKTRTFLVWVRSLFFPSNADAMVGFIPSVLAMYGCAVRLFYVGLNIIIRLEFGPYFSPQQPMYVRTSVCSLICILTSLLSGYWILSFCSLSQSQVLNR